MLTAVYNFRCTVVPSCHVSSSFWFLILDVVGGCDLCKICGDAKISKFERAIRHKINIIRFDIAMHDALLMHVCHCCDQLLNQASYLLSRQHHFLVLCELQQFDPEIHHHEMIHLETFLPLQYPLQSQQIGMMK